jgi:Na+/H+-translocating membrane pyrophosphatase
VEGVEPEPAKIVDLATTAAIKEMILPGAIAIVSPVALGFAFGPEVLAGALAGSLAVGATLSLLMANAGGAWDNAKKLVEVDLKEKGTALHAATVIGDTVGDPFKDTAGPALNPLIKVMNLVSLLILPAIIKFYDKGALIELKQHAKAGGPIIAVIAAIVVIGAIWYTKQDAQTELDETEAAAAAAPQA